MQIIRTKLKENGRIIIPVNFRQNLNINTGDDIIIYMQDNKIQITTPTQSLRQIQNMVKNAVSATGRDISLVDELIATRREEARNE